jgi:triacylglycerol lipase
MVFKSRISRPLYQIGWSLMLATLKRDPKEVLPEITLEKISPPYLDYPYFQGTEMYPFHPDAKTCDMVNAWWLIEASILSWAEEDFVRARFQEADLLEVTLFSGDGTQCFVANNDDFLILVFRGTEIRQRPGQTDFRNIVPDIMADVDILLVDSEYGGKVHRGFKDALDEVWEEKGLLDHLRRKDNGRRTFWFTGHSLGAPLATLATQRYGDIAGLYTYGSPRVGDVAFRNGFQNRNYRFVNNHDIVAKVPPPPLYQHVGELKHINNQGQIDKDSDAWKGMVDIQAEISSVINSLERLSTGFGALIPEGIVDHVPLLYATHIWNNIL